MTKQYIYIYILLECFFTYLCFLQLIILFPLFSICFHTINLYILRKPLIDSTASLLLCILSSCSYL
ncbi:uncharacterized protein BX663DRAFT_508504 [Cokeromyces recurvatus]|uniref:uncharacterized protein n=1 Tax=Cokeromyces recurvatus TaxID=90255 RepID=UPI00221E7DB8|nr:uncharacterized protein BX663DRAFT_508504 [Cokeromyces recurvatus]KAI7903410.1 hypothetical protein BX663DRAFT_508504 [Cokeromyces recurvatus]